MYGWHKVTWRKLSGLIQKKKHGGLPRSIRLEGTLWGVSVDDLETLILHDNLERLFVDEGAIPPEVWEDACERIFNGLCLRVVVCGDPRLKCRCRHFIFGTKVSTSLVELRVFDLEMNQRDLSLLAKALALKGNLEKLVLDQTRCVGPPYFCVLLGALQHLRKVASQWGTYNCIEMVFLANSYSAPTSLQFSAFNLNEAFRVQTLKMSTCIYRLLARKERVGPQADFRLPVWRKTDWMSFLGF